MDSAGTPERLIGLCSNLKQLFMDRPTSGIYPVAFTAIDRCKIAATDRCKIAEAGSSTKQRGTMTIPLAKPKHARTRCGEN